MTLPAWEDTVLPTEEIGRIFDNFEACRPPAPLTTADTESIEIVREILTGTDERPGGKSILDSVMEAVNPLIREMEPEERRRYCADAKAKLSILYGNETGRFFNGFASAHAYTDPDYEQLGKIIMAKRNPHYHPDDK